MKRNAALLLVLELVASCGSAEAPDGLPKRPCVGLLDPPAFELRDVVSGALALRPQRAQTEELDAVGREALDGLATLVASTPTMLELARIDVQHLGPGAWARLSELARDPERSAGERVAAVDLFSPGDPRAARALLGLVADADLPWLRARAAWRLAADGPDHLVPGLLLRLKYEKDHETVMWIATALAYRDNLAGLDALLTIVGDKGSPVRANAAHQVELLLTRFGYDSASELWQAWEGPAWERGFPRAPRSEEFRFEILRWIARFEEFQLRGVDDARFVLERMDEVAAKELASALHEQDVYTRVHAAQCLMRMGGRGGRAGPELVRALEDPVLGPYAAAALGHVRYAPAQAALVRSLDPGGAPALRLASARALGFLSSLTSGSAEQALRPLLDVPDQELAQAAAESLLRRSPADPTVAVRLADLLESERIDTTSSERALRDWLLETGRTEVLASWDRLAAPRERPDDPTERRSRTMERARLIRALAETE